MVLPQFQHDIQDVPVGNPEMKVEWMLLLLVYASLGVEPPVIHTQFDQPVYSVALVLSGGYK
jgi:hypothetical protein